MMKQQNSPESYRIRIFWVPVANSSNNNQDARWFDYPLVNKQFAIENGPLK